MKSEEWRVLRKLGKFGESTPGYMSDREETEETEETDWEGLMTRREVADFLAVSIRTVQRLEARETLTRVTVRGLKLAFYRASEVKALISDGKPRQFRLLTKVGKHEWA
jgi:hypothetical protein